MNRLKHFRLPSLFAASFLFLSLRGCVGPPPKPTTRGADTQPGVAKWERFEKAFESASSYANPVQEASLTAVFTSPSGSSFRVYGFWDGGRTWRIRFAPDAEGKWTYKTSCSDAKNRGLNDQSGAFLCTAPSGKTRFTQHGPVRVSPDNRYLVHADQTPFFYLADTAWNGALLSTPSEWDQYTRERARQKFTAAQFVATQFRAAPDGDIKQQLAYTGTNPIVINPAFFQRLDEKVDALNKAGLLAAPVMLWGINWCAEPEVKPGGFLSGDPA